MSESVEVPVPVLVRWYLQLIEAEEDLFEGNKLKAHSRVETIRTDIEDYNEVLDGMSQP